MALHIIEGDLVGDALIAQRRDKPIEHRGRISVADCRVNAFRFERIPGVIDKRRRASDAANPQDQPGRMVECCAAFCPRATVQVWVGGARVHRGQIIATSLRWASVSPSMYRWVVWIDR
jgi:hypothetical protein